MARVALLRHKLANQALVARAPADGQPPLNLLLDLVHLFIKGSSRETVCRACRDGVHSREFEQADGFLDVVVSDDGREGQFRQGFRYTDDGLELTKINDVRRSVVYTTKQSLTEW